jgi:hypothetical protein
MPDLVTHFFSPFWFYNTLFLFSTITQQAWILPLKERETIINGYLEMEENEIPCQK